ncbi:hypothetical protein SDC9_100618 [bioreactor metagenome]|uniref:HTH marR-type domain-containing protein n=1 Tax=bioreactor metagenome TaxID=1076179 RepID=A0A645AM79_9ZZZZ
MEKNGLIDRRPDEKDARRNRLYITDKGKKTADECRYQVNKMQTALFKKFTASEQVMVQDVLERMLEGIKELENEKDE